jgi:hypothetical protein
MNRAAWVAHLIRQGRSLQRLQAPGDWLEQLLEAEFAQVTSDLSPPPLKPDAFEALRGVTVSLDSEARTALVEALLTASDDLDELRAATVHAIAAALLPAEEDESLKV